jgi:hypothetical protein
VLPSVTATDWSVMDTWWSNYKQDQTLLFAPRSMRELPDVASDRHWTSVDSLWHAFEEDHDVLFAAQHVQDLSDTSWEDAWATIDKFWDRYAEQQQDDLRELQELMGDLRETWVNGGSHFAEDPLTVNWRSESQYEGPLRATIHEEDWSQWLAHLLRTSSGPFVRELLGTPNRSPTRVRREVVFFGESSQRRVDILVEFDSLGVSIEVKQGDEQYGKTPETADLVEQNDRREWSHVLLLQKHKLPRLKQTFKDEIDRSAADSPLIRSDQAPDIDIQYWQDVSSVLRRMLLDRREPNSHWQASAYLFITLIEQRILGLHSFSFIDPAERSSTTDIHRLVAIDPDAQIEYIRAIIQEDHNNE